MFPLKTPIDPLTTQVFFALGQATDPSSRENQDAAGVVDKPGMFQKGVQLFVGLVWMSKGHPNNASSFSGKSFKTTILVASTLIFAQMGGNKMIPDY